MEGVVFDYKAPDQLKRYFYEKAMGHCPWMWVCVCNGVRWKVQRS